MESVPNDENAVPFKAVNESDIFNVDFSPYKNIELFPILYCNALIFIESAILVFFSRIPMESLPRDSFAPVLNVTSEVSPSASIPTLVFVPVLLPTVIGPLTVTVVLSPAAAGSVPPVPSIQKSS